MTASLKIRQLESKISDLHIQHQRFLKERHQETPPLPNKLQRVRQHIKRLKTSLVREMNKMKQQHNADLKSRTRTLIMLGGLLQNPESWRLFP